MILHTIELPDRDGLSFRFNALDEHTPIDDPSLLEQVDNGELIYFTAQVVASKDGTDLASDYLGGCFYKTYEDFTEDQYCLSMMDNASQEARQILSSLAPEYCEITEQAFRALVGSDTPAHQVTDLPATRRTYYNVYGVKVLALHNYVGAITQYYIQDINR